MTLRGLKNPEYREWRQTVLENSASICSICGRRATHAHHIKGWWESPELRFVGANGRALCKPCHEGTHGFKFGRKRTLGAGYLCGPVSIDIRTAIENLERLVWGDGNQDKD